MKKCLLFFVLLLTLVLVFTGCSVANRKDHTSEHVHTYKKISDTATCVSSGERLEVCSKCNAERRTVSPALGHDYEVTRHVDATCVLDGIHVDECVRCGDRVEKLLSALGHSFVLDTEKSASCVEGGERLEKCSVCFEEKRIVFDAAEHTLVWHAAKAPTCVDKGYSAYETCKNCSYTTYAELDALGHDLTTHEAKASTCSSNGHLEYVDCSRCSFTTYEPLPFSDLHSYKDGVCIGCGRVEPVLSGKWRFNDRLDFVPLQKLGVADGDDIIIDLVVDVSFSVDKPGIAWVPNSSEKVEYSSMTIDSRLSYYVPEDYYFTSISKVLYGEDEAYGTSIWNCFLEDYYQTVDFGTEPQEVDTLFYDWFVSNATKVG